MPGSPTVTYAALCRSLSRERLAAYSLETDKDSIDAVARYQWNMVLAAAVTPVLHLVEVAFRNAVYAAGVQTTAGRPLKWRTIPCWLDAIPSLLEPREERDVAEAVMRLGKNPQRHTPGHLVGQLGFGFWLRLCNRPYEHGRASGPQLWPTATKYFPGCPRGSRNRADISRAFGEVRDFRNLVAHHQPIWDRDPLGHHRLALQRLGWLNPSLAAVAEELSTARKVYEDGYEPYRLALARCVTI